MIPTQHPTLVYHTWYSKLGTGRAGIDNILAAPEHIHPDSHCGVDHEMTTTLFKLDHYLIYASFDMQCQNTAPPPLTTTRYHYRRIAEIPLRKTYPKDANDSKKNFNIYFISSLYFPTNWTKMKKRSNLDVII